jgi:hypothetical protein
VEGSVELKRAGLERERSILLGKVFPALARRLEKLWNWIEGPEGPSILLGRGCDRTYHLEMVRLSR